VTYERPNARTTDLSGAPLRGVDTLRIGRDEGESLRSVVPSRFLQDGDSQMTTNPEYVRLSTELLKGKVPQYLFTSSTGVYNPYPKRGGPSSVITVEETK